MVLTVMRFADELVDAGRFEFPGDQGVREPELDMAKALSTAWRRSGIRRSTRTNIAKT